MSETTIWMAVIHDSIDKTANSLSNPACRREGKQAHAAAQFSRHTPTRLCSVFRLTNAPLSEFQFHSPPKHDKTKKFL